MFFSCIRRCVRAPTLIAAFARAGAMLALARLLSARLCDSQAQPLCPVLDTSSAANDVRNESTPATTRVQLRTRPLPYSSTYQR
eukprot:3233244-Prymnesium_polylepis.2